MQLHAPCASQGAGPHALLHTAKPPRQVMHAATTAPPAQRLRSQAAVRYMQSPASSCNTVSHRTPSQKTSSANGLTSPQR